LWSLFSCFAAYGLESFAQPPAGSQVVFPQGDMIQAEPCEGPCQFIGISPFGKTTWLPGGRARKMLPCKREQQVLQRSRVLRLFATKNDLTNRLHIRPVEVSCPCRESNDTRSYCANYPSSARSGCGHPPAQLYDTPCLGYGYLCCRETALCDQCRGDRGDSYGDCCRASRRL